MPDKKIKQKNVKKDKLQLSERLQSKLKKYGKDVIKKCANCSFCRNECPTFMAREQESYFAGGRMRVLRSYVEQELTVDDDFIEAMYFCTTCKQCEDICPIKLDYVDILEDLRAELVCKGVGPYGGQLAFARNVHENKNPFGEDYKTRDSWVPPNVERVESGPYAYFVGCTGSFRTKEIAVHTATILNKLLGPIVVLGSGEYCCGSPLIRTGQVNFKLPLADGTTVPFKVKDLITSNIESLIMKDVREVIYSCSGCYKTSLQEWPKFYGKEIPLKFTHLSQLLARFFKEGKIKVTVPLNKTITYHDPCHLGRHANEYEAPRTIIANLPGVKFVEMKNIKNRSVCCGAGAGVKAGYPEDALKIAKMRLQEAIDTGADMLLTSCVFCKYNFLDAKKAMGADIEIANTEDVIFKLFEENSIELA